ncbi:type I-E CRISPR-associated protein Cse2/CasB [Streptomyces bohaiensis]|uniref:Type I-E CRISPR-associated protein Cse2/CasB n=2 Tax=Streptomyces bohaiensis TaxID=1431344 RepID=A0ABX1C628_9ACTN|nr:type I-E CRISPR-associated protein Cse2/CasB [Streptomyces bohaiensis]
MTSMPTAPDPTRSDDTAPRPYWEQRVRADGTWRIDKTNGAKLVPPGQDLAAMRSGLGQTAGTVPALWPYYVTPTDGRRTAQLDAEHAALSLFGLHQQSRQTPMHKPGTNLGDALRGLRHHDSVSEDALDRRVAALVNATSVATLLYRLRGLITQLRSIGQPLDYSRLAQDINDWRHPQARQRVRRAWGLAYYAWGPRPSQDA